MILCAILHAFAWTSTRARFPAESQSLAALLWFLLAIDWFVLGGLWFMGATGGAAMRPLLLLSSIVPVAVAIGLCLAVSPLFFPVYLQLGAAVLLIVGALRMA
jgi:hypothetical protein